MESNDFWKHNEQFKRAMANGNTNEARHELYQMTQLYSKIIDNDLTGNKAILHAALSLDKVIVDFNLAYFVPFAIRLADTDWACNPEHWATYYQPPDVEYSRSK